MSQENKVESSIDELKEAVKTIFDKRERRLEKIKAKCEVYKKRGSSIEQVLACGLMFTIEEQLTTFKHLKDLYDFSLYNFKEVNDLNSRMNIISKRISEIPDKDMDIDFQKEMGEIKKKLEKHESFLDFVEKNVKAQIEAEKRTRPPEEMFR